MLVSRSFLKFCEEESAKRDKRVKQQNKIIEEMEDHISMAMSENAGCDIYSEEATKGSKNVETLCKAYSQLRKAESEQLKLELQIAEAKKTRIVNWDIVIPKVVGITVAGCATIFWICMEQGTPLPMRLVQFVTNLTLPRNI